jgi:hypothetical protein
LTDHDWARQLTNAEGGPVHVIACHKGVTEAQAKRMLGFPNATVVDAPFDETETQHGVQRFLDWLPQAEQSAALVRFARKRKEVVGLLAQNA